METTKIVIAAGTGFLGQVLVNEFKDSADKIVILTRGKSKKDGNIHHVHWDAANLGAWQQELENADVLINLAGKSVDCRYNDVNKAEILASRTNSTRVLNDAVLACENPPKHWLNSSTATIYRHSLDKKMTESDGEIGDDFSMNVAKAWEKAFFETQTPQTLKTALRTSIVLGKNGGGYVPLKNLAKLGLGGKQGNGKQFVSWIHEQDFTRAVMFIIERQMTGVVNVVAPTPVRNVAFMRALRKSLHTKLGIAIGKRLLELGARIIGTETELVLKSRNVIPQRLEQAGFAFRFREIGGALNDLNRKL